MLLIRTEIVSHIRSLAMKPRKLRDETMEQSKVMFGIAIPEFTFFVLVPAATISLIQDDKLQANQPVTFEEAFAIMVETSPLGDLLYPDPETHRSREPSVAELTALIVAEGNVAP